MAIRLGFVLGFALFLVGALAGAAALYAAVLGTSQTSSHLFGPDEQGAGSVRCTTWAGPMGLLMCQSRDENTQTTITISPRGVNGNVERLRGAGGELWLYNQSRIEWCNTDCIADNQSFALMEHITDRFRNWDISRGAGSVSARPYTFVMKRGPDDYVPVFTVRVNGDFVVHTQIKYEPFDDWR